MSASSVQDLLDRRNFYRFIHEGKVPGRDPANFATFHEGANVMFIIDAVVRSHQEQR